MFDKSSDFNIDLDTGELIANEYDLYYDMVYGNQSKDKEDKEDKE